MIKRMAWTAGLSATVLLVTGCPQNGASLGGLDLGGLLGDLNGAVEQIPQITQEEWDAINAALNSGESLSNAVTTGQSTTEFQDNGSSLTLPSETTFGTCPEVTLSTNTNAPLDINASIDFGAGCSPYAADDYFCSGSVDASFSATSQSFGLSLNGLSCNNIELQGEGALVYTLGDTDVTLEGDWNVTRTDADGFVTIDGNGTAVYDRVNRSTTFPTFEGTLNTSGNTWNTTFDDLQISYAEYGNFTPFNGQATLSGDSIRSVTVRFNSNSPVDGSVEISIDGSDFFETTLDQLNGQL